MMTWHTSMVLSLLSSALTRSPLVLISVAGVWHADEPNLADVSQFTRLTEYEVYLKDELIYQWTEPNE